METDLQLAQRAALVGAAVALRHFSALATLPIEVKADGTVVTAADRAVEAAVRDVLVASRPDDSILGEEHGLGAEHGATGDVRVSGSRQWIIDPIDGTALFVRGDDRWLILIALQEQGEIVLGVAAHPAQNSIWWATRSGGAYEGRIVGGRVVADTRIGVAGDARTPAECRFGVVPQDRTDEAAAALTTMTPARPWRVHPALLVARGDLDLALQTGGQVWDYAATSLIVTEAGGAYSGLDGDRRAVAGSAVYARDDALRLAALAVLGEQASAATPA